MSGDVAIGALARSDMRIVLKLLLVTVDARGTFCFGLGFGYDAGPRQHYDATGQPPGEAHVPCSPDLPPRGYAHNRSARHKVFGTRCTQSYGRADQAVNNNSSSCRAPDSSFAGTVGPTQHSSHCAFHELSSYTLYSKFLVASDTTFAFETINCFWADGLRVSSFFCYWLSLLSYSLCE